MSSTFAATAQLAEQLGHYSYKQKNGTECNLLDNSRSSIFWYFLLLYKHHDFCSRNLEVSKIRTLMHPIVAATSDSFVLLALRKHCLPRVPTLDVIQARNSGRTKNACTPDYRTRKDFNCLPDVKTLARPRCATLVSLTPS
jgi:3',5'-cyclic AMP phosphodiesterase CpdA